MALLTDWIRGALRRKRQTTAHNAAGISPEADALYRQGNACEDGGRLEDAVACYRAALERAPRHARALNNLGALLELQGRNEEALPCYQSAVDADPAMVAARSNLAAALHRLGHVLDAAAIHGASLAMQSLSPTDWFALGNSSQAMLRHDDAVLCYDRALAGTSPLAEARMPRLTSLLCLGLTGEAVADYRRILEAEPSNTDVARRLLLALAFQPIPLNELFAEHRALAQRCAPSEHPQPFTRASRRERRKIRIGYISADFLNHPIGVILAPILNNHDRDAFDIHLYSDVAQPDAATGRFQKLASAWRTVAGRSDQEVAAIIRQDEVDVLVIVAGHFDDNRLYLAQHRAAPVQVSFWDPASSGLNEMDYLIADRGLVPRRAAERFSERVVCIPTLYVRSPLDGAPPVGPLPAQRNGYLTFGSFNAPAKINERTLELWALALRSAPSARLLFQYQGIFSNDSARRRIETIFRRLGVATERLIFETHSPTSPLQRYSPADIALDPVPFNGMTTTFEALWMGVPVLALEGDRMVARCAATTLRKVGLPQWIARDENEYALLARDAAARPDKLATLRAGLRARVAGSSLCDARARARQLERVYRAIWKIHVG